jgi:Ca-activated chloride channel family protein
MGTPDLLPSILLTPIRQAIPSGGGTLEVLVRVQAPEMPTGPQAAARPRLRLALVVDRSGSMDGEPLHEALRCVAYIVDRLQPADEVAVVLYDNQVQVPARLQPASQKLAILAALQGVRSGGNTALFDGWRAGREQLGAAPANAISRVLLLSDGQANHGPATSQEIAPHCAKSRDEGVSTTTVGLGHGFNEDLMTAMAQSGGGQAYYGRVAEDLHDSFAEELALLEALFLRGLRVKPVAAAGVICEPLSAMAPAAADGFISISDLPWRAESWLLVRLHVGAQPASGGVPQALLGVNFEAIRKDGSSVQLASAPLALPVVSDEAFAALPTDELVVRRLQEVEFGRQATLARELIRQGRTDQARESLRRFESRIADHPWLVEKMKRLSALIVEDEQMAMKEVVYKTRRLSSRVTSMDDNRPFTGDETAASEIPMYLRRKVEEGRGGRSGRK